MLWKQDESATAKIHTRNKDACTLILLQRSKFPHTSAAFRILEFSSVKHLSEIRTWMCQYHTPAENICFLHTVGEDGRRPNEVIHRKVKQVHWCSTDADNAVTKRAGLSNLNHAVTGLFGKWVTQTLQFHFHGSSRCASFSSSLALTTGFQTWPPASLFPQHQKDKSLFI